MTSLPDVEAIYRGEPALPGMERSISWAPGEDGALRDSAMYSVTEADWATVDERLSRRVGADR